MGEKDYLKLGSWNAECDRCGFKYKGEELQQEWQGYMVCKTCFEPRNAQDFLKGVPDGRPMPYVRPEQEDNVAVYPFDPASLK